MENRSSSSWKVAVLHATLSLPVGAMVYFLTSNVVDGTDDPRALLLQAASLLSVPFITHFILQGGARDAA